MDTEKTPFLPKQGSEIDIEALLLWLAPSPLPKRLILLIGLPASGKSTLSEKLAERGYCHLSLDAIRAELHGDEALQKDLNTVIRIFHSRLREALSRGLAIVVDGTGARFRDRSDVLSRAHRAGYSDTLLLQLDVPLKECLRRNRERARHVPESIIVRMFRELKGRGRPRPREGKLLVLRPGSDRQHYRVSRLHEPKLR